MISIVTPVYNAASFICQTIKMVQKQTYEDWELILVDDGSKDNSVEIIEAFLLENPDSRKKKKENRGYLDLKYKLITFHN